jgi:ABC-type long-subunit fatty acid transport system fused permease/ATPase subunit
MGTPSEPAMIKLMKPFFAAREHRMQLIVFLTVVVALIVAWTVLALEINDWRGVFFDAIQGRDYDTFIRQMGTFAALASCIVFISSFGRYYQQRCVLYWRKWMTEHFIDRWTAKITSDPTFNIENANQRIQEDLRIFTNLFEQLTFQGIKQGVLLIVFAPIAWSMSAPIEQSFNLPHFGLLFWAALIYSGGTTAVSIMIGRKMPKLEYNNQRAEAHFRTELVLIDTRQIPPSAGLKEVLFAEVYSRYKAMYWAYKNFTLWSTCFGQFSVLIPFLIASPAYFSLHIITLGFIMKVDHAFGYIQQGISYIVDNFLSITELTAATRRLKEFEGGIEQ